MAKLKAASTSPPNSGDKSKNSSVIAVGYTEPNAPTKTQLSTGFYSLNKRSNVPFVKLVGAAGFQKTITWGETTVVPEKEMVTVYNASYHGGDIFLNKDIDPCNRPSRISVPVSYRVTLTPGSSPANYTWQAIFPCDVRTSKRAYLNIDALAAAGFPDPGTGAFPGLELYVRGRRLDGSLKTTNILSSFGPPYGPGVGFIDFQNVPMGLQASYIPLGQGAVIGDDSRPHMLLDAHDVFLEMYTSNVLTDYLTWPAFGTALPTPIRTYPAAPETFYIVEYD